MVNIKNVVVGDMLNVEKFGINENVIVLEHKKDYLNCEDNEGRKVMIYQEEINHRDK